MLGYCVAVCVFGYSYLKPVHFTIRTNVIAVFFFHQISYYSYMFFLQAIQMCYFSLALLSSLAWYVDLSIRLWRFLQLQHKQIWFGKISSLTSHTQLRPRATAAPLKRIHSSIVKGTGVQRIWLADRQADANSESNSGTLRNIKEQQHKGAMGRRTEARGNAWELNRRPDMEDWEHGDRVHKGGRDNWTLVKDIRAGQTITKAGKLDKHRN